MSLKTDRAIHLMVECSQKREKKGTEERLGRKLIKSDAPKRLWDDYLELESCIRSNTGHGIYKLDLKVPEKILSSKTSDISQFCELEWFKWVMF